MKKLFRYLFVALATLVATGCIDNDIPYPIVKLDILTLRAEGEKAPATINTSACTVDFELEEIIDIRKVEIKDVTFTEGAEVDVQFPGRFDMRNALYVNLTKYQTFEWTIRATQNIERYFRVEGQIGVSEIDAVSHIATAYVPMDYDMNNVRITAAKFGPKDITTYYPDPLSFTSFDGTVHHTMVSYHGDIEEMWTLKIIQKDIDVEFSAVDAWAKRIWLYANGRSGEKQGFRYRTAGSEEWTEVENVEAEGGSFSACIEGLEPLTDYEVMAYVDDSMTPITKVTTDAIFELPNSDFEEWHTDDKGIVRPYALGGIPFWGSGNDGAAMASTTLTEPTEDIRPGSEGKYAASLQSKKAALMGLGKFAAGNIFLGEFGGLVGLDGLVNFGRPSTARPVALHGWVKYNCGAIDELGRVPSSRPNLQKGDMDEGQIMIAVGRWTAEEYGGSAECPVVVNTKDESTYFDKNGKDVIGVGEMILTESTNGWMEFTLPLDYRSTSDVPTHMIIVCTGSRFGDYFTGSTQSLMLVDDLTLVY